MIRIVRKLKDLSFEKLMEVYAEGNRENGQEFWPQEPPERQLALAEQDFYNYLSQTFFAVPGGFYALWEADGRYACALRMEPYQDGYLLEALETAPELRHRGYAKQLILGVLEQMGQSKIYSHVHRRNIPSMRVHESCGFRKVLDHAVYADGSVLTNSVTLLHDE